MNELPCFNMIVYQFLLLSFFKAGLLVLAVENSDINTEDFLFASATISAQLAVATEPEELSHLPADLNATNSVLSEIIGVLESSLEDNTTNTTADQVRV